MGWEARSTAAGGTSRRVSVGSELVQHAHGHDVAVGIGGTGDLGGVGLEAAVQLGALGHGVERGDAVTGALHVGDARGGHVDDLADVVVGGRVAGDATRGAGHTAGDHPGGADRHVHAQLPFLGGLFTGRHAAVAGQQLRHAQVVGAVDARVLDRFRRVGALFVLQCHTGVHRAVGVLHEHAGHGAFAGVTQTVADRAADAAEGGGFVVEAVVRVVLVGAGQPHAAGVGREHRVQGGLAGAGDFVEGTPGLAGLERTKATRQANPRLAAETVGGAGVHGNALLQLEVGLQATAQVFRDRKNTP